MSKPMIGWSWSLHQYHTRDNHSTIDRVVSETLEIITAPLIEWSVSPRDKSLPHLQSGQCHPEIVTGPLTEWSVSKQNINDV
ncbi:hypothetical protein Bpfe_010989 [Biomphalaria pfeifferi]|uniref:Uncharacterized protein n=1 Tax=Biomphalaria pfeifferi TaxID=112525 RepID=A0AAD8BSQ9_BIOPF|nr:hypothetical protein Bpfe_010989 [Biomphalaria pfeifferi]